MTAPVSLLPQQAGWTFPGPSVAGLSDDEQRLVRGLSVKLMMQTPQVLIHWAYYDGLQRLQNLGISIPPQLTGVRTVVDWPRVTCDPLVNRAVHAGFRLPKATEVDDELEAHWTANDMAAELPLAILDSLVAGRGYVVVGSPDEPGESPVVTVESPLNMTCVWDPRTRRYTSAYQASEIDGIYTSTLHMPDQTVYMSRTESSEWVVDRRDEHGFGEVPIARIVNRARSSDREGRSQITAAVMNTTDSCVRSLLGMEIGREVYSIPHLWVIGASNSSFTSSDGSPRTAIDMAMTKMLAFERDEDGNEPKVGQFKAFDPSVFTKIIDKHAQLMASYTGFPPAYFGQVSTANPASADAIRVAEAGIDREGSRVQAQSTPALRRTAQLIWRFAHRGEALPDDLRRIEVDWQDARTPTPAATSDAVTKQVAAGILPARSDVTLAELDYTPLKRARIAQDWADDPAAQLEGELTSSLAARQARAANAIASDLEKAGGTEPTVAGQ